MDLDSFVADIPSITEMLRPEVVSDLTIHALMMSTVPASSLRYHGNSMRTQIEVNIGGKVQERKIR